ncbi:MAG TPA: penicillin-insensitive murein endopeptidase, partial [Afifellaceae bacterium]|nr:penicillin-insensitive murein endopeptidase [Afifellaceae bacterium]
MRTGPIRTLFAALGCLAVLLPAAEAQENRPAKELFGGKERPAALESRAIGFYSRGCLAGGTAMPVDGPHWQAMRLSRNRNWGHPRLIDYLQWLAREAAQKDGWPGLLVGDLSQPRGGPMLDGHASHQIGLDADVWLTPMPSRRLSAQEREEMSAVPVVEAGPYRVHERVWTDAHFRLIRRAASHPEVERIFVAPGIKHKLCEQAGSDRGWLGKVRPYWGHNYHMHVRLACPRGEPCRSQDPVPRGDGCGDQLAWWLGPEPWRPADAPAKPRPPVRLSDLP